MKKETIEKMIRWLSNSPESAHPFDDERFYDFVNSLVENEQCELDDKCFEEAIKNAKQNHKGSITDVEEFYDKWSSHIDHILEFVKFRNRLYPKD